MKDKAAIAKAAQKFAAKGQIDKAIAEWEKLLAHGKDGNIYNTVGDLFLKKGATKEAVESFSKAAETFREDGFYLKAMALYKKILNISPSEVSALIALAELNVEKGLIGNAIENFLAAAEIYSREGAIEKALEIYEKILPLAPPNINLKIKIAELYLKIGLSKDAVKEYVEIASDYLEKEDFDKAREFYLRGIGIDSHNIPSLIGLSKIAEKTNDIENAVKYLKDALSSDPNNKDVLLNYSMLAINTDNIDEAKKSLSKLLEIDPSHLQARKLLGSIYLKEGLREKAWRELLPYIDEALHAGNWTDALEFLDNFKDLYPIPVKQRLVSIYKGKGDKESAIRELKELARLYEDKELYHNALQSYKEFLELNPDDKAIIEKIKKLEDTLELITPPAVTAPLEEKPPKEAFTISSTSEKVEIPAQQETVPLEDFKEKPVEKTPSQTPMDSDLSDVLHELKEIEEKDHETHYNLGIAYKEMGLLDEAIREFQIAVKDPEETFRSSTMLASCYMEKGLYPLAIKELKKVIETMSPGDKKYLDVKYELAGAYVKNKDYENAIKLYNEIYKENPKFKDIAHKVEILKSLISKAKDKAKKSKKDRVSYI